MICNELNLIKKYDSIGTNITLDDYVVDRVRVFEIVERKLIVLPCVVPHVEIKSNVIDFEPQSDLASTIRR